MKAEWTNKDSLEIPETTVGYGSVPWSDYKTGTSCDSVGLPTVDAIPVAFIEEQMRKYEELAYNSTPKIQQRYFDKEDALKSLINNWREKNGEDENETR